ncbi:MAG TPA: VOC family protein [Dongiaceae bacterium]|nr:VOC family protein [Dongiaceae bacterium]
MRLDLRRITFFTGNMAAMTAFYRDVIGLEIVTDEPGWKDFAAGNCHISLHRGKPRIGARAPKIAFYAADIAAARAALVARGATTFGKVIAMGYFARCEATDPDGNAVSISSRP